MIRDFAQEDQPAVRRLVLDGMRERWGDAYDPALNSDMDDITASHVGEGATVVVVERGNQVVATGTLVPIGNDRGRIVRLSVDRRHRRRGLGRAVVGELIDRARQRGWAEVIVLTDTPWTSAVALYRACGFTEVGRDETDTHFAIHT